MVKQWFRYLLALMVCCLLGWNMALAAVTAHVDRFNISEGETVNLTIEVSGDDSGEPQTSVLQKDFEILSNSKSSSYSFINGASSSKTTYELMLRPRHTGALTIPSLKVGSAVTGPIMIQVSKMPTRTSPAGLPTGDVWISMDIEPARVRVQQQAVITIRVYQAVGLNNAQLTEPKAGNAIVERLGDDASYQKRENNRTWQVTERHYALFPQHSGQITIEPVQLDGSALVGGTSFFQTARPIRVRSNALTLDVGAIPDNWAGDAWLPAKYLNIEEIWPQGHPTFKVGEPITRTLTLHADGLSASQLPELPHDLPDHLKSYADKPVLKDDKRSDGVHGMRQEKLAIMPMQTGTYILPEIDIAWWNTITQKTEHAVLPARTFTVLAAPASASAPAPTQKPQPAAEDVHSQAPVQVQAAGASSWWQWLALFFATGWLLTLVYVWRLRRDTAGVCSKADDHKHAGNIKQAVKAVETACEAHDAKACEKALLQLAGIQCPGLPCHSLSALAALCSPALQAEVSRLEQVLYGPGVSTWQGDTLLRIFRQEGGLTMPTGDVTDQTGALPGLYPD
ncbi:MAG: BatD family protein [Mariprofundus sp.]|nr:BatD family protein [Mariprofundus sp.]